MYICIYVLYMYIYIYICISRVHVEVEHLCGICSPTLPQVQADAADEPSCWLLFLFVSETGPCKTVQASLKLFQSSCPPSPG